MSGLIFKGDVVQSTGEYLPAPYINKITAFQDADADNGEYCLYNVQVYVFADDYSYVDVLKDGEIKGSQDAYKEYLSTFNYYIMAASGLTQEIYDKLTMGQLNPLSFYKDFVDNKTDTSAYANGDVRLYRFDAFTTESPQELYDETGNRVVVYPTTIQSSEINTSSPFEKNVEYIFCFCSLFNYDNDSQLLVNNDFNEQLLNLQTGDVSYERFYSSATGNTLEAQESAKFYDVADVLYDKTPLASIQQDVFKILNVSHDDIKDSMNSLLSEYSTQYNAEKGFEKLKTVMNAIYSTLAQYGDNYDIVPRLEVIRATFPDKNPSTPVGKLYKRYSKRIFEINRSVQEAEMLYKKLTYNIKISDQRFEPLPTDMTVSNQSSGVGLVYSEIENFTNLGVADGEGSVVAGYFFFDYEKALRLKSRLSEYLNINKLEMLGFNLPYQTFMVKEIQMYRDGERVPVVVCKVKDSSVGSQKYPLTERIDYESDVVYIAPSDDETYNEDVSTSIFYGSTETTTASENASLGYVTSLVNRAYAYTPSDEFENTNYRLMLYELLEYRKAYDDSRYSLTLTAYDDTLNQYENIFNTFADYYSEFVNYASLALEEACVYNHNLEKFNEFFIQNLIEQYEDTSDAIWYTAPVIYAMFLDLLYDKYGGDIDEIEAAAKAIVNSINPNIGNIESIENFLDSMEEMYAALNDVRDNIRSENDTDISSDGTFQIVVVPEERILSLASIEIPEPQDKIYAGEAEGAFEMSLLEAKTGVAIHGAFAITNDGGGSRSNLYPSLFPSNMTSPIAEILSVSFRELKDGMYQEEVEIPPSYTATNSDGTQQGSYTDSNGNIIYAYHAGNYNFTAYKLGIYTVYYN